MQRRHGHWRRYPARPSPGRLQCAGDLLRRRAQHRTRRASRRGSPIIACDLRDNKLDYAKVFSATHTINATAGDVVERVREMTDGLGVGAGFHAIGSEKTALQIIDAVASGGRAVLVGTPAFSAWAAINPSQIAYGEKVICATYYGSVRPNIDFPMLADLDLGKKSTSMT